MGEGIRVACRQGSLGPCNFGEISGGPHLAESLSTFVGTQRVDGFLRCSLRLMLQLCCEVLDFLLLAGDLLIRFLEVHI